MLLASKSHVPQDFSSIPLVQSTTKSQILSAAIWRGKSKKVNMKVESAGNRVSVSAGNRVSVTTGERVSVSAGNRVSVSAGNRVSEGEWVLSVSK